MACKNKQKTKFINQEKKKPKNQITARKKKENKQKLMIFVNRFDQITDKLQITD